MKKLVGIAASNGIAIGKATLYVRLKEAISKTHVDDVQKEIGRFEYARREAIAELEKIYEEAVIRIGKKNSSIFQIHIMMLNDDDFIDEIKKEIISDKVESEYAVWQKSQEYAAMFAQMDDDYMRARAADVMDISRRLLGCLDPKLEKHGVPLREKCIVAARELMPSETVQMDRGKELAFVTQEGSRHSHSAILARTMGIPAVVGLGERFGELKNGMHLIVDGMAGELILEPDKETIAIYKEKSRNYMKFRKELERYKGTRAVSRDGYSVVIHANIGSPDDLDLVLENDAEGIGLLRSEFLYMDTAGLPSEEEQFRAYKTVLQRMEGKRVIVRTLDIGADKPAPYLEMAREENPAMGYRAIRISLDFPELFLTQLRALLRASAFGNLAIMFPMITSVEQVCQIKKLMDQARQELAQKGCPVGKTVELGVMIETPASALLSAELAREVDFFSIGTNDLTQYTLAVDRTNPAISKLYDPSHPAVLRLVRQTVESAKKAGIWVGVCGESAADPALTRFFLSIGVDELSVAPSSVLELRKTVLETTVGVVGGNRERLTT